MYSFLNYLICYYDIQLCYVHLYPFLIKELIGLIHRGQYCKPAGECNDAILLKILHNHIAHITHTPMGQFECDATACFDRMVMLFVLQSFIAIGAPKTSCQMWERCLQNVIHHVRTAFGDSKSSYASTPEQRIEGPGQGSQGGPLGCTIMCTPLLEAQEKLAHGITFYNP